MSTITIIQGNNNDKDNTRAYMVKGESGVSPTVSVERTTGGAIVTTTDYTGEHTAQVNDGVSPTVETSKTAGVTTITITDYEGEHTATINDGQTYEVPAGAVIGFDGATVPAGYEEVDNPNNYSTTETKIGTWIDGKPLYRKVMVLSISTGQAYKEESVSNLNINKIIDIKGIPQTDPVSTNYYETSADKFRVYYVPVANKIAISLGTSYPTKPCDVYVILEYTKTTD